MAAPALRPEAHVIEDALQATAVALLARTTTADVLRGIVERASDLAGPCEAYVYLVDAANDRLEVRAAGGATRKYLGITMARDEGVAGRVWATGRPLLVEDYASWEGRSPKIATADVRSVAGFPLSDAHGIVGVLGIYLRRPDRRFDAREMQTLERFAQLASLALEHARLVDERTTSEALFRTAFERAPTGRAIAGLDGRFVEANAALAALVGRAPEELVGMPIAELLHPDERALVAATTGDLVAGRATHVDAQRRYLRKDGSVVWVRVVVSLVRDARGAPLYFVGDIMDIDEERRQTLTRGLVRNMLHDLAARARLPSGAMRQMGRTLAAGAKGGTLEEVVAAFQTMGLGTLRLVEARGGRYAFEADDLLERRSGATRPTCEMALGFLEGAVHAATGREALGTELRCQSLGHARCTLVVKAR